MNYSSRTESSPCSNIDKPTGHRNNVYFSRNSVDFKKEPKSPRVLPRFSAASTTKSSSGASCNPELLDESRADSSSDLDPYIGYVMKLIRSKRRYLRSNQRRTSRDLCDQLEYIEDILESKKLNSVVKSYNSVSGFKHLSKLGREGSDCCDIASELLDDIFPFINYSSDYRELYHILSDPNVKSVLEIHDQISQRNFEPQQLTSSSNSSIHSNIELPDEDLTARASVGEGGQGFKIVTLVKSPCRNAADHLRHMHDTEPIVGATIKEDELSGRIVIARVMRGGAADRSGLIHPNDEVIEVNDVNVQHGTPNDVLRLLQQANSTVRFKLLPPPNNTTTSSSAPHGKSSAGGFQSNSGDSVRCVSRQSTSTAKMYNMPPSSELWVRALLNFDCKSNELIPCKDAGISFRKNDILKIVNQRDQCWWQALNENDPLRRTGLIPSRILQEKLLLEGSIGDNKSPTDELHTYEEVCRYLPKVDRKGGGRFRPLVLVGVSGVGRNEIINNLLNLESHRFKTTIPTTTRLPRPDEVDGEDYHFTDIDQMKSEIENGRYIEFGTFNGNLYGTSVDSIRQILDCGMQPIVSPHYQAVRMLRTPDLKPFVVHISPPSFERLKLTRSRAVENSTVKRKHFQDEDLEGMISEDVKMEEEYGHMFDVSVVNDDLISTIETIIKSVRKLDFESQWIPSAWLQQ